MMYILSAHGQSQLDRMEPKRLLKKMSIWDAVFGGYEFLPAQNLVSHIFL